MPFFEKQNKLKAVTFSYDDGVTQDIRLIQLLDKYGLKCTFNLNSDLLGKKGILARPDLKISHYKVAPEHVKGIYENHEVAVHTLTHPRLPDIADDEEIIRQVEQDRINLSELVGYDVVGMAYPCGGVNYDDRVIDLIKNKTGVKYCRTINNTDSFDFQENLFKIDPNVAHIAEFNRLMEMGKKFVESKPDKPQIYYIWGHSYEMDARSDNWVRLEEFFKLISGHDDIFYGTNKEVFL